MHTLRHTPRHTLRHTLCHTLRHTLRHTPRHTLRHTPRHTLFRSLRAVALASLCAPLVFALSAQGRIVSPCARPLPQPTVVRPCGPVVARVATSTLVEISGRVARTTITETFENRGASLGEADFVFPLPSGAAFEELRLEIDGQLVAGEVLDAKDARETYERIVRELRDPVLVEWAGLGLLRTRIFPFRAGERRTVVVKLAHVAPREGDALRVAGRLVSGTDVRDERATGTFRIRWRGDSLGTPWSPTHTVARARSGLPNGHQEVSLTGRSGDVVAYLPIRRVSNEPSVTVLSNSAARPGERGERHALIIVAPPRDAPPALPRDITLVLDVSGSMSGEKMKQSIAAGHALLGTLRSTDRFRLVAFADDIDAHTIRFTPVTSSSLRDARRWLHRLNARGGTNISGALHDALRATAARTQPNGRLPLVLLLTDGQPTVGLRRNEILDSTDVWRADTRVFTFGVGADVDATLVEQLAIGGRGAAHFVRPEESVERAVSLVAERLSAPLLANVQVSLSGGTLRDVYTPYGTDLMAGQELLFLARYSGDSRAQITVTGTHGTTERRMTSRVDFSARDSTNAFVPRLWAVQRVAALDAVRRRHGASDEIDTELKRLGERYGIPTPLTSYFVQEANALGSPVPVGATVPGARGLQLRSAAGQPAGVSQVQGGSVSVSSNAAAFAAARQASEQRRVVTLSAADEMLRASLGTTAPAASDASAASVMVQVADGRAFDWRDSTWTDRRLISDTTFTPVLVVRVQAYSAAWSALAREMPSLRESLALGDRVRVRGTRAVVEVTPNGATTVTRATLDRLITLW